MRRSRSFASFEMRMRCSLRARTRRPCCRPWKSASRHLIVGEPPAPVPSQLPTSDAPAALFMAIVSAVGTFVGAYDRFADTATLSKSFPRTLASSRVCTTHYPLFHPPVRPAKATVVRVSWTTRANTLSTSMNSIGTDHVATLRASKSAAVVTLASQPIGPPSK